MLDEPLAARLACCWDGISAVSTAWRMVVLLAARRDGTSAVMWGVTTVAHWVLMWVCLSAALLVNSVVAMLVGAREKRMAALMVARLDDLSAQRKAVAKVSTTVLMKGVSLAACLAAWLVA